MNTAENFFLSLKKMDIGTGHGIPKTSNTKSKFENKWSLENYYNTPKQPVYSD